MINLSQQQLRQHMRDQRRELDNHTLLQHAEQLCKQVVASKPFRQAGRIAAYVAFQGEADPLQVLKSADAAGKSCYLPRISGEGMTFHQWKPGQELTKNNLGIDEPAEDSPLITADALDLVLVPLTAFDHQGNRIGMGGGYYDRCFDFKRTHTKQPFLLGAAHAFQQVERITAQDWDVAMDAIATENTWIDCSKAE